MNDAVTSKFSSGLELARVVTNCIEQGSLRCRHMTQCRQLRDMDKPIHKMFESAIHIAMQCPTLILRQRAVQFLKK